MKFDMINIVLLGRKLYMKIFKRISILGLSMSMILGPSINVNAETFIDLPKDNWAYESVQWGVDKGLVVGYKENGQNLYRPSFQITEEEFVSVLARYLKDIKKDKLVVKEGTYWAQPAYDELSKYELPLKGENDIKAKKTGLTRGTIARIIAAKNGFNLDERQAVYYMYENGISYGQIGGKLSFQSYGRNDVVTRAQIPAFFQRLEEQGSTTFMGKESPVKSPDSISGIAGIPKDPGVITDEMFDKLNKEVSGTKLGKSDFDSFKFIAEKHKLKFDLGKTGFNLNGDKGKVLDYSDKSNDKEYSFNMEIIDYNKNKQILLDIIQGTEKLTETEIKEVVKILEIEYPKTFTPKQYFLKDRNIIVSPSGNFNKYSISILIPKQGMKTE